MRGTAFITFAAENRYNSKVWMNMKKTVALFDLDGVIFDTEAQYSVFWGEIGRREHPEVEHFDRVIKGQTLVQIYGKWFAGQDDLQQRITKELDEFEKHMNYEYVPGVERFLQELRANGVHTAVVTSSNDVKMRNVYKVHPEFSGYFDEILTSERFRRSKPAPDCYLLGAEVFGADTADCVVFEDSFHGLEAGRGAGMKVVGLSTTNAAERIAPMCDCVIPDFTAFGIENLKDLLA